MKIKTEFVYPAIPIRTMDWVAYDDDTYDPGDNEVAPGPTGHGATEAEAIADFKESWELRTGENWEELYGALPDPYLLLGAVKLHLSSRKPGSRWPLMSQGDQDAWTICDRLQSEVLCG